MRAKLKRRLLLIAGTIFTGIGIIGIIVPILPTTPFLLLAAACYLRSSEKFHHRLLNNRFLGIYITNYLQGKGMTLRAKVFTILLLWVTIGFSMWFATQNPVIRIILASVALGVSTYLILLKSSRDPDN